MYPERQEVTLFDSVTPVAITSSTDATPIVVTATAHGLKTGQRVLIYGHTTNIAANGIFVVGAVTANTFGLTDEITGANVAGSTGLTGAILFGDGDGTVKADYNVTNSNAWTLSAPVFEQSLNITNTTASTSTTTRLG